MAWATRCGRASAIVLGGLLATLSACDPGAFDALVSERAGAPAPVMEAPPPPALDAGPKPPRVPPPDAGDAELDAGPGPAEPAPCPVARDLTAVQMRARELGVFPRAASADYWLGMGSAKVGSRVLWLFHRPSDAAAVWGDASDLRAEPPRFDAREAAPSLLSKMGEGSLLTGGVVAIGAREALIFFASYEGWLARAAGLARIALDAERAELLHAPGELFGELAQPGAPGAFNPVFASGAFIDPTSAPALVYVFACQPNPAAMDEQAGGAHPQPCRIARAPAAEAERGASYRYWDGAQWTPERAAAAAVIDRVQSGQLSVSYNRYLASYLAVNSADGSRVLLRHAPRPEGPWLMLAEFVTEPAMGGFGITHSALEHPALREACDNVTYVSYARPVELAGDAGMQTGYETRMVRIELR